MRLHLNLPVRKRAQYSERRAAQMIKGRLQPNSGAMPQMRHKADVKSEKFLLEDKTTTKGSYSLRVETWRKLSSQAFANNRLPILRIEFASGPTLYVLDELGFASMKGET